MPELQKDRSFTVDQIFQFAREHPFYRERLKTINDFSQVPLTDKKTLYAAIDRAAASAPGLLKGAYWSPSGGSVAEFLLFYPTDPGENHYQRQMLAKHLKGACILSEDTVALNMFGSTFMYRSMEIFNEYCELCQATSLPVSAACSDEFAGRMALRFKANTLIGLPSRILQFARYALSQKLSLTFKKVVFAGESLPLHKREFLNTVFATEEFYGLYGSAEAGVWAYQSVYAQDAEGYLFPSQLMHVEIIEADKDGFGNIVTTNLVRSKHPLLRYDSGDVGRLITVDLAGTKQPLLQLKGRMARSFHIGGEYYSLEDFEYIWQEANLLDYQITLEFDPAKKMDIIKFSLVPDKQLLSATELEIVAASIRKIVQSNDATFVTEVVCVQFDQLERSTTAQKVLKIVDKRPL